MVVLFEINCLVGCPTILRVHEERRWLGCNQFNQKSQGNHVEGYPVALLDAPKLISLIIERGVGGLRVVQVIPLGQKNFDVIKWYNLCTSYLQIPSSPVVGPQNWVGIGPNKDPLVARWKVQSAWRNLTIELHLA